MALGVYGSELTVIEKRQEGLCRGAWERSRDRPLAAPKNDRARASAVDITTRVLWAATFLPSWQAVIATSDGTVALVCRGCSSGTRYGARPHSGWSRWPAQGMDRKTP